MRRRAGPPRAAHDTRVSLDRRRFLGWLSVPALAGWLPQPAAALAVQAARLWPAREYTRMTLESAIPIGHQLLVVRNPDRLVLDLDGVDLSQELQQLAAKVSAAEVTTDAGEVQKIALHEGCLAEIAVVGVHLGVQVGRPQCCDAAANPPKEAA